MTNFLTGGNYEKVPKLLSTQRVKRHPLVFSVQQKINNVTLNGDSDCGKI